MATLSKQNRENLPGSVFTDTTCIDCGTCYHLAPAIFEEKHGSSVVISQPEGLDEWGKVKRALVSCPTNSIGIARPSEDFKKAELNLPLQIDQNVFYCGFTAESSYGATTYLIERPEGNILIDSPRFHPLLVKELERRGGIHTMILTHRDDVADHQLYHDHFHCQRVIHIDEIAPETKNAEYIWQGDEDFDLFPDLRLIKVPGHTKGHLVVLYQQKYLFTGDHLFMERGKLRASHGVCWYSWEEQIKSTRKLLNYSFEWVLPGHDGWGRIEDSKSQLNELISKMEQR